jgi:hypothetical protein
MSTKEEKYSTGPKYYRTSDEQKWCRFFTLFFLVQALDPNHKCGTGNLRHEDSALFYLHRQYAIYQFCHLAGISAYLASTIISGIGIGTGSVI